MEPKSNGTFTQDDLHAFCAKLSDEVFDRRGVRVEFLWTELPDGGIAVYTKGSNIGYTMYPHVDDWIVTVFK